MTPEEYQRIKEAEKEHLRALKKLKTQLREVQRKKSVAQALENMTKAPGDEILSTHEEMIDRLAMDTIRQEARLEVALSDAGELDKDELDVGDPGESKSSQPVSGESVSGEPGEPLSSKPGEPLSSKPGEPLSGEPVEPDAELQKIRAQDLVRQIKIQMGLPTNRRKQETSENVTHRDSTGTGAPKGKESDSGTPAPPVRPNQTTSESLPEKTIGRIPRKKP